MVEGVSPLRHAPWVIHELLSAPIIGATSVKKIVALEEERLPCGLGQGVSVHDHFGSPFSS
jgi:hypothetical protein